MKRILFSFLIGCQLASCSVSKVDMSGTWSIRLDSLNRGMAESWQGEKFETSISLPGTTDDAGLGVPNRLEPALQKPQLTYLTRANRYVGAAWYSKEISVPSDWDGKDVLLNMERVLWDTQVWVDKVKVKGHEESLTTPHVYNLTPYLKPGKKHTITVRVDNSKRYDISNEMAHAYTDHTQIKWNGILGDIEVKAVEKVRVEDVQLYPEVSAKRVKAVVTLHNGSGVPEKGVLEMKVNGKNIKHSLPAMQKNVTIAAGDSRIEMYYDMGDDFKLWDEFSPSIYQAVVSLKQNTSDKEASSPKRVSSKAGSSKKVSSSFDETLLVEDFGMRELYNKGNRMMLNGNPLFLRGTLECCIFPLTGTPPMDKDGWKKVFGAAREYGLNHLRFHSWCPPEAAFEVADEMGFYLQVELPTWVLTIGKSPEAVRFLLDEAARISREYGNHPSFCLWSLGNELQGDFNVLSDMLDKVKSADDRHLYTTTSFTFEKGHGGWPEKNDDFFVTQWTNKGWVRGQGVFNQEPPSFNKNYNASVEGMEVPLITHEIGQYSVYPDLSEIKKYKGVLKPLNFMAVEEDLKKKGLIDKAPDYLMASGKLASLLYKEEVERALKTAGISGFQLLDLHDFPGQGTALVGLLNAFWESKGIITGDEFREFCSPVVPLLNFPKAVYRNNERFEGEMVVCNYGSEELRNKDIRWEVRVADGPSVKYVADGNNGDVTAGGKNGKVLASGSHKVSAMPLGYNGNLGNISVPLAGVETASRLEVRVWIDGTEHENSWNIWVYPDNVSPEWGDVKYTRDYEEARRLLAEGKSVLFNPVWKTMKGIEGKFVPVFWSPVHFPNQAGTMGVLCNPEHKALSDFPTDMHTDWQWWDLNINSTTLITDSLRGGSAIVEMVDNFANNRRLASLYEAKVGNGRLVLATFDLKTDIENRPVAKQMLVSVLKYMNSGDFNPSELENFEDLKDVVGTASNTKQSADGIY